MELDSEQTRPRWPQGATARGENVNLRAGWEQTLCSIRRDFQFWIGATREGEARMNIGCVVLASGESVRFGSNKLLADFGGKPMLSHLLDILPESLQTIVVTRSEGVKALAEGKGFACILHHEPEVRDTIRLGLEALQDTDACLFCVGDQPLISRVTLERMLNGYQPERGMILRAGYAGNGGNPALFPRSMYPELMALGEGESGVTVIRRHMDHVVLEEVNDQWEMSDVDTPETLRMLESIYLG